MSEVPVTHIFYCAWLKTQVETCVTGTLDMSQAPLRHKWKPGLTLGFHCFHIAHVHHSAITLTILR